VLVRLVRRVCLRVGWALAWGRRTTGWSWQGPRSQSCRGPCSLSRCSTDAEAATWN